MMIRRSLRKRRVKGQYSISTDAIMGFMFMILIAFFIIFMKGTGYVFTKSIDMANDKSLGQVYFYQMLSCDELISLDDGNHKEKFIFDYSKIDTDAKLKENIEECIGTGLDWAVLMFVLDPIKQNSGDAKDKYVMGKCAIPTLSDCRLEANGIGTNTIASGYFDEEEKITKIVNLKSGDDVYLAKLTYAFKLPGN